MAGGALVGSDSGAFLKEEMLQGVDGGSDLVGEGSKDGGIRVVGDEEIVVAGNDWGGAGLVEAFFVDGIEQVTKVGHRRQVDGLRISAADEGFWLLRHRWEILSGNERDLSDNVGVPGPRPSAGCIPPRPGHLPRQEKLRPRLQNQDRLRCRRLLLPPIP
uniref:DUF834 domain-containing protein n=1 Tax=Leersia perrieri TaxID=77586 RepID=A0A0D9XZM3_9ORYZ